MGASHSRSITRSDDLDMLIVEILTGPGGDARVGGIRATETSAQAARENGAALVEQPRRPCPPGLAVGAALVGLFLLGLVGWVAWNPGALLGRAAPGLPLLLPQCVRGRPGERRPLARARGELRGGERALLRAHGDCHHAGRRRDPPVP